MQTLRTPHDITPTQALNSEDLRPYHVGRDTSADDATIAQAIEILRRRLYHQDAPVLDSPATVRDYLTLQFAAEEREVFGCVWLSCQNRVLADGVLFTGTLTQTSVYPREVVKDALRHNAGAVIFYHNHPSGNDEPSSADERLTGELKRALALVDVRVLDHFIVAGSGRPVSFAERGLI